VALVGPTGVGKTTTAAKLAARFALRHGADHVALVTTDSYRVGATEQLRTYGRIMGVPVRVTRTPEELRGALQDLSACRLVLIDTAGMSQRDMRLSEQLTLVQQGSPLVQVFLVLSATTQPLGLEEVVRAFRGIPIDGCILTKLDEAVSLGALLSVLVQHGLPVGYLSDGQRVPEDIRPARAHVLVNQALQVLKRAGRRADDQALELAYGGMAADGRL
jgi:flagellar biosynthesis protein FlhF